MTIAGARMSGNSGDGIVFVHGVGSTAAIWDYQLAGFGSQYRCFAVELRGNGASKPEPPPEQITREGFVEDVLAVADAAQLQHFHVVGCSLGGVVAFELWKRAPQRLRSMVLAGSFAAYDDSEGYAAGVIEAVRNAGSMAAFAAARAEKLGLTPGTRMSETIEQMACKSIESYCASTQATWTGDYRALLPTITVPVLVVCGARDAVAPPRYSEEIARAVKHAHLDIIADAGHVVNADAPGRFNALLKQFLSSNVSSATS